VHVKPSGPGIIPSIPGLSAAPLRVPVHNPCFGSRDTTVNPLVVGMVEKPSGSRVPCKLSMGYP